jgi:HK97 family phage portal protein
MPVDRVRTVIDRRSWPYQILGYKLKLETREMEFKPYEVIHFRLPNARNFFEGYSPVMAGAEYIDNDNYAMEFNRRYFVSGVRPAGFLKSDFVAETQLEALKIGFADVHEGVANMNRIGVLPKGVEWQGVSSTPKDMDFKNMSEDMRDRILAMFGVSRTILGTALEFVGASALD